MEKKESGIMERDEPNSRVAGEHKSSTIPRTVSTEVGGEAIDIEECSDNDDPVPVETSPDEDIEDIVGFSIGQEQLRMKSPDTPAFEKAKALDQSKDYFDLDLEDEDVNEQDLSSKIYHEYDKDPHAMHDSLDERVSKITGDQSSPSRPGPDDSSHLGMSRSILKDGFGPRTRRASSGSTGMVGTLRKLLPDLPSMSFPKAPGLPTFGFGSKSKEENQFNRSKRSGTLFSRGNLPWVSSTQSPDCNITTAETTKRPLRESHRPSTSPRGETDRLHIDGTEIRSRTDHNQFKVLSPRTTPDRRLLRRATSDNSLFLRNDLERTTTQEESEKWADISEQINSRFKAITDSFQDSAMRRIPKIPSVSLGSFKPGVQRSNSETARLNTDRNIAITPQDTTQYEPGAQKTPASATAKQTKHAQPILNQAVSDLTGDVVVLGGYRGSILRSAKPPNKQLWVPVKVRNVPES